MEKIPTHKHNGTDSERIEFTDLSILPESPITNPSGGAVVDAEARTALIAVLEVLRSKGLLKE